MKCLSIKRLVQSLLFIIVFTFSNRINSQYTVTNTNSSGTGSLAEAINNANSNTGPDNIFFNISGSGPFIIQMPPSTILPTIFDAGTIIDASTQPSYYAGIIELKSPSQNFGNGFTISANNVHIYGLKITGFGYGIRMSKNSSPYNTVYIGEVGKGNIFYNNAYGVGMFGEYSTAVIKSNEFFADLAYPFDNTIGIHLQSSNNIVGGINPGEGNKLHHLWRGISYASSGNQNILLQRNSLWCNITPIFNFAGATSTPAISVANSGFISGTAPANSIVEVFYQDTLGICVANPCQGQSFIDQITADGSGYWSVSGIFVPNRSVTANAKSGTLHTSVFSSCATIIGISGCTDSLAHNFNPSATSDDGSCLTCSDGIQNGDETGIDCGGSNLNCVTCSPLPCPTNNIFITSQEDVDSYEALYHHCHYLNGSGLYIGNGYGTNSDITDLSGFDSLYSVWFVQIVGNPNLLSLNGLHNLTTTSSIQILDNDSLINLSGLESLNNITDFIQINDNENLEDLTGIGEIISLKFLEITNNPSLLLLSGLDSLTTISNNQYSRLIIDNNPSLISLINLSQLNYVGKDFTLSNCHSLHNLDGLQNLDTILNTFTLQNNENLETLIDLTSLSSIGNLIIEDNDSLSQCEATSICNFLADTSSIAIIQNNNTGCNNTSEVQYACSTSSCTHLDFGALMALYNSTNGANWNNNSGWNDGAVGINCDPCTWYGIGCDSMNRVVSINLDFNGLVGGFPLSVTTISQLQVLQLNGNAISGSIPTEIGILNNLIVLNLTNNSLSGIIPSEIGNLTNLSTLSLGLNFISGSIPSEIGNLINLHYLYLGASSLSGNIPIEIGNLVNLTYCDLRHCQLSGNIPPQLGNLINLYELDLFSNQLTGSVPSELGNLTNLLYLTLHNNQLSGELPPQLGNLLNVRYLNLSNNALTGNIPGSYGNLTLTGSASFLILNLSSNNLSGCFNDSLQTLCGLNPDFSNNPLLPNDGDFPTYCTTGEGQCEVLGCTDTLAHNYNPNATTDDGTCETCSDTIVNGDETGIDCGGITCSICLIYYVDNDMDGFGSSADSIFSSYLLFGYSINKLDCDDADHNLYPGATELCDEVDQDCDGDVDEGVQNKYYADVDMDGFGNPLDSILTCNFQLGYVINNDDCNDALFSFNPLADEICDELDNDCDGNIDETCGCTNELAHNYNSEALYDDGSCETCSDGIKNGDELGVDCGGNNASCPICPPPVAVCYSVTKTIIVTPADLDYNGPGAADVFLIPADMLNNGSSGSGNYTIEVARLSFPVASTSSSNSTFNWTTLGACQDITPGGGITNEDRGFSWESCLPVTPSDYNKVRNYKLKISDDYGTSTCITGKYKIIYNSGGTNPDLINIDEEALIATDENASMLIYPNPGYDNINIELNIDFRKMDEYYIRIFDILGREVNSIDKIESSILSIDTGNLVTGTYRILLNASDKTESTIWIKY